MHKRYDIYSSNYSKKSEKHLHHRIDTSILLYLLFNKIHNRLSKETKYCKKTKNFQFDSKFQ